MSRSGVDRATVRATQRATSGAKVYGDFVTRMRIANQLNLFGHSTSLDTIGYNPQPPDVTGRLGVARGAMTIAPSESHFQSPLYDRTYDAPEGESKIMKTNHRMTKVPLRTWGGGVGEKLPSWKDFQTTRHNKITRTLRRKTLRETGKASLGKSGPRRAGSGAGAGRRATPTGGH